MPDVALEIRNDGAEIVATNYWQLPHARGFAYASVRQLLIRRSRVPGDLSPVPRPPA